MNFNNSNELDVFLNKLLYIGMGSQGSCYLNNNDKTAIKIFHDFDDDLCNISENEIMRFSNIKNKTFIWPSSVIRMNNNVIGYISPYIKAKNLCNTNPLNVNLNKLEKCIQNAKKDIDIISEHKVLTYDVMYNTMLGNKLYIIDSQDYCYKDCYSKSDLINKNNHNLDYEIYYFLVDSYFNNVINNDKDLSCLYVHKEENVLEFLKLFKKRLSELSGMEINSLRDAKKFIDPKPIEHKYIRTLN